MGAVSKGGTCKYLVKVLHYVATLCLGLGWKTIDQLITSETNIMVYKSLHELAPQYMCNLFTRASQLTSRCLRNTLTDLRLPKKNSKTGQKCFSFRGATAWNDLSAEGKLTSLWQAVYSKIQSLNIYAILQYFIQSNHYYFRSIQSFNISIQFNPEKLIQSNPKIFYSIQS